MIKLTDTNGVLLPSVRFLITLIAFTIGIVFGWIGHMNWGARKESDQLIRDAKVSEKIRNETIAETVKLELNVEKAIDYNDPSGCLDMSFPEYVKQLRDNRAP
jgi:hypothetical protein